MSPCPYVVVDQVLCVLADLRRIDEDTRRLLEQLVGQLPEDEPDHS